MDSGGGSDPACASQFCVTPVAVSVFTSTTYGIVLLAQLYTAATCVQSRYCRTVRAANVVLLTSRIVWDLPEMALGYDGANGFVREFFMCLQVNAELFIVCRWIRRTTKAAYNAVMAGSAQSFDDHRKLSITAYVAEVLIMFLFVMFFLGFKVSLFKPWCSAASLAVSILGAGVSAVVVWMLAYTYRVVLRVAGRVAERQEQMAAEAAKLSPLRAKDTQLYKLQKMLRYFRRVAVFMILWITPLTIFCTAVFVSRSRDVACRTWMRFTFACIHLFFVANIVVHTAVTKDKGPGSTDTRTASNIVSSTGSDKGAGTTVVSYGDNLPSSPTRSMGDEKLKPMSYEANNEMASSRPTIDIEDARTAAMPHNA